MTRYLIKITYLEGPHKGQSYLRRRGGYCTEAGDHQGKDTTYATLGIARSVCKKLYENNELDRKIERQDEAARIKRGRPAKEWYIYESCSYEPYPVEVGS